jgi:hypothetical protein
MFFRRKEKKIDKRFVIFLSTILLIALLSGSVYFVKGFVNDSKVILTTNRRTYREGEYIEILIVNKRKTPIYFIQNNGAVTRVWDVQIMDNGEWVESKEPIFGNVGRYALENKVVESDGRCNSLSSKVPQPHFFGSKNKLSAGEIKKIQWDQLGCLISSRDDAPYVKTAARGMYRLFFEYSYEKIGEDGSIVTEEEVVYSRPFYLR